MFSLVPLINRQFWIKQLKYDIIAVDFSAVSQISWVLGKKTELNTKKKETNIKKDGFLPFKKVFEKRRLNI